MQVIISATLQDIYDCKRESKRYSNVIDLTGNELPMYMYSLQNRNMQDTYLESLQKRGNTDTRMYIENDRFKQYFKVIFRSIGTSNSHILFRNEGFVI